MVMAIFEALIGVLLLIVFLTRYIKIPALLIVSSAWSVASKKFNLVNKWWFNLIFLGISLLLIFAPVMQLKASKLDITRDQYVVLQSEANKYGMSVETYFEEIKTSKELKFKDVHAYLNAKKFGVNDPEEFSFILRLGRQNLSEWNQDKEIIAKNGKTMEQYVQEIEEKRKQAKIAEELDKKSDETPSINSANNNSDRCIEMDKGKALIEIYNYSCDSDQLAELEKKGIVDTLYCRTQGNIKKRKIPC
jgi:glutathione peroxidase-family protein